MESVKLITAYSKKLGIDGVRLQLRSFPRIPPAKIDEFVILLDDDESAKNLKWWKDVSTIARDLRPLWPTSLHTCRQYVPTEAPPALKKYVAKTIGFKCMLPLWYDDFLFMDGDIVVTRDMTRHLEEDWPWASRQGLDRWFQQGPEKAPSPLALEVQNVFDFLPNKNTVCDAAMFRFQGVIPPEDGWYKDALFEFFSLPTVVKTAKAKAWHPFFQLDQKWLSVWLTIEEAKFVNGGTSSEGKMQPNDPLYHAYSAATAWKSGYRHAKKLPNATFWHYCVSGCKPEAIKKYEAWLAPDEGFLPEFVTPHKN